MSDTGDRDNKTEEATDKRRGEALEQGGPTSREVNSATVLLVLSIFLATAATRLVTDLAQYLAVFIEDPGNWRLESSEDAIRLLKLTATATFRFLGLFVAAFCAAALAASFMQNTPRLILSRIMPDFSRISPSAGLGRLFNTQSVIELFKGLAKVAITGFAGYAAIGGIGIGLAALHSAPDAIPELIRRLCLRVAFYCALMACGIAVVDVLLTRSTWRRNLMMSKQEVKEEMKQSEGDLALKARLRAIARSRIRRRMLANVPKATVVITNPTHYAIALRYVRKEDSAPKVLAKGQDNLALKIREIAELHSIPVVENKSLARSLFNATEIDQLIPSEFYKAVAEVIIYLDSKSRQPRRKTEGGTLRRPSPPR